MQYNLSQLFILFFEKNLFERLVLYILASHFITNFFFVLVLGQWGFGQSQHQQWIFYGLLGMDYLFSFKKILNIRFRFTYSSFFALFIFIMIAHGLFIGFVNHNKPFVILNDTIPLLMIAFNILRMQSLNELSKPIDFKFVSYTVIIMGFLTVSTGTLANYPTIGNGALYFPLMMAALLFLRPLPVWAAVLAGTTLILISSDLNRTTIAFLVAVCTLYFGLQIIYRPARSLITIFIIIMIAIGGWTILPKDSKTYARITKLTEIDLSQRTGSIGERQAEQEAVQQALNKGGPFMVWTGLGFGGLYDINFTHDYIENYGHAHYSWVWFNMRFGKIGYIYLLLMTCLICFNIYAGLKKRDPEGYMISLLSFNSLLYLMTYVNGVFLLSGLPFKNLQTSTRKKL